MKYNNSNYLTSDVAYSLDTWHEATITYSDSIGRLYLDDSLAISFKFDMVHGKDKTISLSDFSDGVVFKGIFSDLKIYTGAIYTKVIEEPLISVTKSFSLSQNYPNPFNPSTRIKYQLATASHVVLTIYNLAGQEIATLVNKFQSTGEHEVTWQSKGLPSGLYFYKIQAGEYSETKKLILQK
ncbi:MAG: T9SS type A sorting domain-containing protein [bacterium]|nr:T9SS type A sorting domain-containing protein [bacterium]